MRPRWGAATLGKRGLPPSFLAHLGSDALRQQRGAALAAVSHQQAAQAQVVHVVVGVLQVQVLQEARRQAQPAPRPQGASACRLDRVCAPEIYDARLSS